MGNPDYDTEDEMIVDAIITHINELMGEYKYFIYKDEYDREIMAYRKIAEKHGHPKDKWNPLPTKRGG